MSRRVNLTDRIAQAAKPGEWVWDTGAKGLVLRVTPKGVKTFLFRYRLDGVQQWEKVGRYGDAPGEKSVKDAREQALVWGGLVAQGKDPVGKREAETLRDLADFYLKEYAPHAGLRPSTIRSAEIVLAPMLESVGNKRLSEFRGQDVRRALTDAKVRRTPAPVTDKLNPSTGRRRVTHKRKAEIEARRAQRADQPAIHQANRLLTVLSKMFNLAEEQGWREEHSNPCAKVKRETITRRDRYLTEEEIGRLLTACDAYPNQSAANVVRLLLYTGARLNEALKAEWSQFDLEANLWEKPSAHTKTKIVHRVPLSGPVVDLLKAMREANPKGRYVFPGEPLVTPGKKPLERPRADLKRPWAQICKAAGIKNARRHDLRRTTASLMASAGNDRQTIGRVLGHTQAATTDSYVSIFGHAQAAAVKGVGERMAELRAAAPAGKVIPMNPTKGPAEHQAEAV